MNISVTSKEAILRVCRQIVSEQGLSSLNMRAVAAACGASLGALYYHFPSKNDLLIATIESVWEDIFRLKDIETENLTFPEYIEQCFNYIQLGIKKYPNFFTIHSISFSSKAQGKAQSSMQKYLSQIKEQMLSSLNNDKRVNKDSFNEKFTRADFIDFMLLNIMSMLLQRHKDCSVLQEIIRRTIY